MTTCCTHFFCEPAACTYLTYKEPDMGTDRVTTDGLDHSLATTELNFLKEGDKLRIVRKSGRVEVLYATTTMDGHSVSTRYGKAAGTDYFDDPTHCYINVQFDHVEYSGTRPNSSIKATDPFVVYVNRETRSRINEAKAGLEKNAKKTELEQKLADAEAIIASVRAEMKTLGL